VRRGYGNQASSSMGPEPSNAQKSRAGIQALRIEEAEVNYVPTFENTGNKDAMTSGTNVP
jgi:hypothetical protein